MSPDVVGWIAGGLVTLLATVWTARGSRRTAQAEQQVREISANAEAAKQAQQTYSGIVSDLRTEVDRLHDEVDRLRAELNAARRAMDRMTRLLTANGIPLPRGN